MQANRGLYKLSGGSWPPWLPLLFDCIFPLSTSFSVSLPASLFFHGHYTITRWHWTGSSSQQSQRLMSSCLEQFCMAVEDLLDTNSNKCTLNPEPEGTEILNVLCSAACVCVLVGHLHIEEVQSYTVEAFAVSVGGQGWRPARSWVLAAVARQRDDQGPPRDLLRMSVVVLLVLGVNLCRLLVRLYWSGDGSGSGSRGRSGSPQSVGTYLPLQSYTSSSPSSCSCYCWTSPGSRINHLQLLTWWRCRKLQIFCRLAVSSPCCPAHRGLPAARVSSTCITQRGGGCCGGRGDGVGAIAVYVNSNIPESHEQWAGTAGQTSTLSSCTKGPGVHQQSFSFSALGQAPTTKCLINRLCQGVQLQKWW